LFGAASADAYALGIQGYFVPAAMAAFALVGVVIHSMEPGIFTTDKNEKFKPN
jgi:hypothetical protein